MTAKDPHSCWSSDSAQIKHIDFTLDVDFDRLVLTGHADYQFDRPLPDALHLDTRDLNIVSVVALDPSQKPLTWSLGIETFLGKVLTVNGTSGLTGVRIAYSTSPEAAALQWLAPSQTAGGKHPYVFSQCQAILARTVFPCHDTPSVRFTYDAVLTVPKGLAVVMAAELKDSKNVDGKTSFHFHMRHPIPSYLFAFAAGNIVSETIGPRSRVFAEPEVVKAAAWEFDDVERMIQGAEKLYGDYIWDRFDLLVMPPSFPYGGMENPTLTFLTPTLIAGDRSLVSVVAHELAHSWTGNLVTNATWEDFWLNEGWTVYAERRIVEQLYSTELANLQAVNGRNDLQSSMDTFGPNSEYTKLKTDLTGIDPDDVFSSVPYEKGFLLLVAIERAVGRERFDRFVRSYIENFRFSSLVTHDFGQFLKAELPGVADTVELKRWVHDPDLPTSAPGFASRLIDDVRKARARWDKGERDLKSSVENWIVDQKVLFLEELVGKHTPADCVAIEKLFGLESSRNGELLCPWFCIAAASNYSKVFPRIREFLGVVGRGKYLKPIYRALHTNPETRALAREMFDEFKTRYHSVGRNAVQKILSA